LLSLISPQFGQQEQGSNEDIKAFAKEKYGVTFPLFSKINVNGPSADPFFDYLKSQKGGEDVKWNFTKVRMICLYLHTLLSLLPHDSSTLDPFLILQFLVDREGHVVARYPTTTSPLQIESDILKVLN
jgi:glutathione peroxidase